MLKRFFKTAISLLGGVAVAMTTLPSATSGIIVAQAADDSYSVSFTAPFYSGSDTSTVAYKTITYEDTDGNGSVSIPYPFTITNNSEETTYTAYKKDYILSGWQDESDVYTVSSGGIINITNLTSNLSLSPVWTGKTLNITFKSADGQTAYLNGSKAFELGKNADLSLDKLGITSISSSDYFAGWQYSSNGTQIYFDASENVLHTFTNEDGTSVFGDTVDINLTAVLAAKNVTITLDANGGTGSATVSAAYGEKATLPDGSDFSNIGKTLVAWNTKADGSGTSYALDQISYGCFGFAENTTLYAVWGSTTGSSTPTSYTVSFVESVVDTGSGTTVYTNHANSTLTTEAQQYYDTKNAAIYSSLPSQAGFFVDAWEIVKYDAEGQIVKTSAKVDAGSTFALDSTYKSIVITPPSGSSYSSTTLAVSDYVSTDGTIYFVPIWKKVTIKLAYNANGGSGTVPAEIEISLGTVTTFSTNELTLAGKAFMGYSTNGADASSTLYTAGDYFATVKNTEQTEPLFSDPWSKYLNMKNWEGQSFVDSKYWDRKTGILDLTSLNNYQIFAIWDTDYYTIAYDRNEGSLAGASGTMTDQSVSVGVATALSANQYLITGYDFIGWNTAADGSGTSYANKASVTDIAERGETITLYAQWKASTVSTIPLQVSQTWDDSSDQDGVRPDTVTYTVTATANNTTLSASSLGLSSLTFTVNSSESLYTLATVPTQYLSGGTYYAITYSVSVSAPSGYTYSVEYSKTNSAIKASYVYSYTPKTTNFTATVTFSDSSNQDGKRPTTVTLTLKGSDGSTRSVKVTITGSTQTYTFESLPMYYNQGSKITYTVSIAAIDGYDVTVKNSTSSAKITATHEVETVSTTVQIVWKDTGYETLRPTSVTATLTTLNGKSYSANLTPDTWTSTISKIDKYYQGSEVTGALSVTAVDNYSATVSGTITKGYTVTMTLSDIAKKTADKTTETVVTKTSEDKVETSTKDNDNVRTITIRTIWNDGDQEFLRPLAMTINLVGSDGNEYQKTLTTANGFTTAFQNVPAEDEDGATVEYKISYSPVDGYTTHVYHNRSNEDEFIIEQFYPTNDASQIAAKTSLGSLTAASEQTSDLITIGGVNTEEIIVNEDGELISTSGENNVQGVETADASVTENQFNWHKYFIPGAIILGALLLLAIAGFVIFKRN